MLDTPIHMLGIFPKATRADNQSKAPEMSGRKDLHRIARTELLGDLEQSFDQLLVSVRWRLSFWGTGTLERIVGLGDSILLNWMGKRGSRSMYPTKSHLRISGKGSSFPSWFHHWMWYFVVVACFFQWQYSFRNFSLQRMMATRELRERWFLMGRWRSPKKRRDGQTCDSDTATWPIRITVIHLTCSTLLPDLLTKTVCHFVPIACTFIPLLCGWSVFNAISLSPKLDWFWRERPRSSKPLFVGTVK